MNDLLETLQADITAILSASPALLDAVVLSDNEGDIEAKVSRALASLRGGTTDKRGLAVVVLLPEVTSAEANLPGPPLMIRAEIRTLENVLFNRGASGTGLRSSQAALAVLSALHHHIVGSHSLYAEKNPIEPVDVKPGHVSHAVTLYLRANGLQGPGKVSAVSVEMTAGAPTGNLLITSADYPVLNGIWEPGDIQAGKTSYGSPLGNDNGNITWDIYAGGGQTTPAFSLYYDGVVSMWSPFGQDVETPDLCVGDWLEWYPGTASRTLSITPEISPPTLTLTTATAGAAIYYTTDGSYPTPSNGTLYPAPIAMPEAGTQIRAAAYATGLNPGDCLEFTITE